MEDLVIGEDNRPRCGWGVSTTDYVAYHDNEWGRPATDDRTLFEKLCLEGFQSGLSWITILRKRDAFREVFAGFDAPTVATFDEAKVLELLDDARIIRHRGKIEASISNARALMQMHAEQRTLRDVLWAHRPTAQVRPVSMASIAASTPESTALAKELKKLGFRFVGPTTAYAAMQAMGVVNDHLQGCWVADECENAQQQALEAMGEETHSHKA